MLAGHEEAGDVALRRILDAVRLPAIVRPARVGDEAAERRDAPMFIRTNTRRNRTMLDVAVSSLARSY